MLMSAGAGDTASLNAQAGRRWQAIDPLLPVPGDKSPGCGARLVVDGAGGQPAASGTCVHRQGVPGSLDLTWGAARGFQLTVRLAGPDAANALDQLLSLWRDHLARVPGADGEDTAAIVSWPSRDIDGAGALLRHGLAPLAVVAARTTTRHPAGLADGAPLQAESSAGLAYGAPWRAGVIEGAGQVTGTSRQDLRIRRAGPADIDAVVRLGLEVIRFDAHFGSVTERPETADALRRETAGLLAVPETWTWLAERDGTAIGMLCAERPESAGWIAPMVRPSPVAYLLLMGVAAGERGSGVGTALAARLHREIKATGVAVTLLHYAQLNPLSVPFWSQQGYRPLWTAWEARPARTIR
jgi:GNAT superfamily N-acetyltransferase